MIPKSERVFTSAGGHAASLTSKVKHGIVLAAGSGKRMLEHLRKFYGTSYPKQYVAFTGKRSMIQHTLDRAERLIPRENLLVVVDPRHRGIVEEQLGDRPPGTLIFQPINRETAPGILLPLSHIYRAAPDRTVAIFPSDHFIHEEDRFMTHIASAAEVIEELPDRVVLLGIKPDTFEPEYGWIQPGGLICGRNDGMEVRTVEGFHEKPDQASAERFFKDGYLWNTLVTVARCSTLWSLLSEALPAIHSRFEKIVRAIGKPEEERVIRAEYEGMEEATISRDVFERFPSRLLVMNVMDVLWNDWGNGRRVLETLRRIGRSPNLRAEVSKFEEGILTS